jgi:glucose/arabinose dehydrogenase
MRRIISGLAFSMSVLLAISLTPVQASDLTSNLKVQSQDISETLVEGGRGAALAVLSDGSLLLAGGELGDTLFSYSNNELKVLGKISTQKERGRDSRFGPTDIGVLSQSPTKAQLLISYPQLQKSKQCVRLVVFRYNLDRIRNQVSKQERWFIGNPCVPVGAIQHAAGRIEVINSKRAYLTTGDLGFSKINQRNARGTLGAVFEISAKSSKQLSQGHRNPQGIVLVGKDLYISEHGPRGGDEINLISAGQDYGWPFVSYGAPYSSGDYVRPTKTGTHEGFTEPLYQWTPSVAPTELVLLPRVNEWGNFKNHLVMGTLAAQSLFFIELTTNSEIGQVIQKPVGERIRDLELLPDHRLVATTDGGQLLYVSLANN